MEDVLVRPYVPNCINVPITAIGVFVSMNVLIAISGLLVRPYVSRNGGINGAIVASRDMLYLINALHQRICSNKTTIFPKYGS